MANRTQNLLWRSKGLAQGMAAMAARTKHKGGTRLSPGGWLSLWMKTGHYEVTQEAVEAFGFSSAAVEILCDAAQDPDLFEFDIVAAHAQTPDAAGFLKLEDPRRQEGIEKAITDYKAWVTKQVARVRAELKKKKVRHALYFLGYALHAVEDLAAHSGVTNPEHAAIGNSLDDDPARVDQARCDAKQFLRTILHHLDSDFDRLRRYEGDGKLSMSAKSKLLKLPWNPATWAAGALAYKASGGKWKSGYEGVRWSAARVFSELCEAFGEPTRGRQRQATSAAAKAPTDGETAPIFVPLVPERKPGKKVEWTIMVYMAGDDDDPDGIEYAVGQDLREMKLVGSTRDVHFLAQTDEYSKRNSYRYRLRSGTHLDADRLAVYKGDLNTGKVSTLVDFVSWAVRQYPAKRYGLVLWGHGSGHDDKDIYRMARGLVSPRLASRIAQRRLGFFGGTRRALLSAQGPNKGFGFDSTAADFLDNREIKRAMKKIKDTLKAPLDFLGFDACLMANTEVAYQVRGHARFLVASEESEPGDGWAYTKAFNILRKNPACEAEDLGRAIVKAYGKEYEQQQTLSLVDLQSIRGLSTALKSMAKELEKDPALFHKARTAAINFSPPGTTGYRDLGTFLDALQGVLKNQTPSQTRASVRAAAKQAAMHYQGMVRATAGRATGLTIYLPGQFCPHMPGGTDALYQMMDFPSDCGWFDLLSAVYRTPSGTSPRVLRATRTRPRHGSRFGVDRHNLQTVLQGLLSRSEPMDWMDISRRSIVGLGQPAIEGLFGRLEEHAARKPNLRIFIVPGIMGSLLTDRAGDHGLCWIDPVGLAIGSDWQALRLAPKGGQDADPAVHIEALASVPLVYDRLALSLMSVFGPVVEYLPYDWRKPLETICGDVARRLVEHLAAHPEDDAVLVAHSMGGLVAAGALQGLPAGARKQVKGLVAMGTPWLGSFKPPLVASGQSDEVKLFARLTPHSIRDVADVAQTFWGLTQMFPDESPGLRDRRLYAPGPLASSPTAASQLRSPGECGIAPPVGTPTVAIVGDSTDTIVELEPGAGEWQRALGPGDGTVPLRSATAKNLLEHRIVDATHVMIPLDGDAIQETISQILAWTGRGSVTALKLPAFVDGPAARDRESFLAQLEHAWCSPLSFGTFRSLMLL